MKFFNSNVPKVCYSDTRHQFYIKSSSLALRPLLYFRKNSKCGNKSETFFINEVIVPIFYQSSSVTSSKVYYSNTRHQFCVNWALLSLWPILHLRKNFKHCKKLVRFFLNTHLIKFFQFIKIWIQADQKSITVVRDISFT